MKPREVEAVASKVKAKLSSSLDLGAVVLTDSAAWYREQFDACGNWDSWVWETVTGRDYATREKHFHGFIVLGDRLGRASAGIVDLALRNGRAVLAWKEAEPLLTVQSVVRLDDEDMVSGWGMGTTDIKGLAS
jgi:hypothetical protein